MAFYHKLGKVAPKRHTQFRKPDGGLYYEELFGTRGFSGPYSLLYHLRQPTGVTRLARLEGPPVQPWELGERRHHHLRTKGIEPSGDPMTGRRPLLYNDDVVLSVSRPTDSSYTFFRNSEADEIHFVHEGSGELHTIFGTLDFRPGDYLVIPRGTIWQMALHDKSCRFLVIEGYGGGIETPARYRNEFGQLLEQAPYSQRDIRLPEALDTHDEEGDFEVVTKLRDGLMSYQYAGHPFDVAGWDGYVYPWALNIADIDPITGRVHQPPPTHQTFQGPNFVVCTFLPRKLDYHPLAIPSPYNHINVDYDEVLYYANNLYSSRTNVEMGSVTLHRRNLPHGPQPGAIEASIGKTETKELAVMLDTLHPLRLTTYAQELDDPDYPYSWVKRK